MPHISWHGSEPATTRIGQGAADNMVQRRVHFIFDRATRRFKGDEQLWLTWIEYSEKSKASTRLSVVFARALAMLPRSSKLWIRAAAWELETRGNAGACARTRPDPTA